MRRESEKCSKKRRGEASTCNRSQSKRTAMRSNTVAARGQTEQVRLNSLSSLSFVVFFLFIRHLPSSELLSFIRSGHVLLLLVDHRLLHCLDCSCISAVEVAQREADAEFSGHFILLCGADSGPSVHDANAAAAAMSADAVASSAESETMLHYLDPSIRPSPCRISVASLERARISEGTDEDASIISLREQGNRVPQLNKSMPAAIGRRLSRLASAAFDSATLSNYCCQHCCQKSVPLLQSDMLLFFQSLMLKRICTNSNILLSDRGSTSPSDRWADFLSPR